VVQVKMSATAGMPREKNGVDPRNADWNDLRYFLELSRTGTLAASARRLGVDYTTVGRRIAALERQLEAKLFERTPGAFMLTAVGESIRAAAEQMEEAAVLVEQRALGSDRKLSGVVRLTTTELLGHVVALPAIRELHERHPQIRVDMATNSSRLDLARREADLALRFTRPDRGNLVSRRAGRIAWTSYASRGYLASHPRPQRGKGLAGQDIVVMPLSSGRAIFGGDDLREARVVVSVTNSLALREAAALGLGIAELPCSIGDDDRRLRRVFPDATVVLDDLWLVVHPDVQRTRRVRAVIEALDTRLAAIADRLTANGRRHR
jgi:DNA-binding transcriptional LysR family regulator